MSKKPNEIRESNRKPKKGILAQLLEVAPKEMRSGMKKVARAGREIEKDAKKTEDSIDRGARRTKHRFSL
jgi:hypothetical protein